MSNEPTDTWPDGALNAYTFPGGWDGIDEFHASVHLREGAAIGEGSDAFVATGMVQLRGPWVRISHDAGTVLLPFDRVAWIEESA